jgi:hypothetical protein
VKSGRHVVAAGDPGAAGTAGPMTSGNHLRHTVGSHLTVTDEQASRDALNRLHRLLDQSEN